MHDDIICTCFQVSKQQIIDTFNQNPHQPLGELKDTLMIGYGCGSCDEDVSQLYDALKNGVI